jgi:hypothetical protein
VRPRLLATGGFALVFLVLGVAGPAVHAQAAAPRPVATSVTTAPGSTCAGTAADRKGASIAWSRMKNPIFGVAGAGAKDESLTLSRGRWHLLMSSPTGDPVHWRIASATSHDLVHWSKLDVWPSEGGVRDPSSPDVIQRPDGTYVVTYQAGPPAATAPAKLYYRTSRDLVHWTRQHELAWSLHPEPDARMIDGALAAVGSGLMLGYKSGSTGADQAFEMAYSPSGSLDGPWTAIGRPDIEAYGGTIENYEFVDTDGQWRVLGSTNNLDRPWVADLVGPADQPASWLHWTGGRELQIAEQAWDHGAGVTGVGYERANSSYLCDARAIDGHYYLLFAGSNELTEYGGWGHARVGIARSTDLTHWDLPTGTGGKRAR